MPTYRYFAPDDPAPHVVVAARCQQGGRNVDFYEVTAFDEPLATLASWISVIAVGEVEVVDWGGSTPCRSVSAAR